AAEPDRPALLSGPRRLTYAELDEQTDRLAAALAREGLAGRRVALLLDNSDRFALAYLGVLKAGAAAVPLHPTAPVPALAETLGDSAAAAVFVEPRHRPMLADLAAHSPGLRFAVV